MISYVKLNYLPLHVPKMLNLKLKEKGFRGFKCL